MAGVTVLLSVGTAVSFPRVVWKAGWRHFSSLPHTPLIVYRPVYPADHSGIVSQLWSLSHGHLSEFVIMKPLDATGSYASLLGISIRSFVLHWKFEIFALFTYFLVRRRRKGCFRSEL